MATLIERLGELIGRLGGGDDALLQPATQGQTLIPTVPGVPVQPYSTEPPRYSTATVDSAFGHQLVSAFLSASIAGIDKTTAGDATNMFAQRIYDTTGEWPDPIQLLQDPEFWNAANKIPTNAYLFPSWFSVQGDDGALTLYDNRAGTGPLPVTHRDPAWIPNPDIPDADWHIPGFNIPTVPQWMFQFIMDSSPAALVGGGGGGGGGGRAAPIYDQAQIEEAIRNHWRAILLEEPDDTAGIAKRYITEAQAFARQGGHLDLDTWTRNQLRESRRYGLLYARMPSFMSEDEYVGQYRQAVGQFGLNERVSLRETEAGMSSGAGMAGFTERVSGTREAGLAGIGSWSHRFAQSVAQLGALGRVD